MWRGIHQKNIMKSMKTWKSQDLVLYVRNIRNVPRVGQHIQKAPFFIFCVFSYLAFEPWLLWKITQRTYIWKLYYLRIPNFQFCFISHRLRWTELSPNKITWVLFNSCYSLSLGKAVKRLKTMQLGRTLLIND